MSEQISCLHSGPTDKKTIVMQANGNSGKFLLVSAWVSSHSPVRLNRDNCLVYFPTGKKKSGFCPWAKPFTIVDQTVIASDVK